MSQGYGMTEAGPVLSMCLSFAKEPFPVKSGACGTVVRNAELKVVDPDTGASLGRNQPGEICIRGAQIMKGIRIDLFPSATDCFGSHCCCLRRKETKSCVEHNGMVWPDLYASSTRNLELAE